jgi:hypothetical protein
LRNAQNNYHTPLVYISPLSEIKWTEASSLLKMRFFLGMYNGATLREARTYWTD